MKALQKGKYLDSFHNIIGNFSGQRAKNPLASMTWRLSNTLSIKGAPCAVCGSYEDVQMHHVRALKDIVKSTNHKYMIAIERYV